MNESAVAGLVLAGGRGSRLGASMPKPLVDLAGRPMIAHVLDRFPDWISPVVISANDGAAFAPLGLPVVPDRSGGFGGPLVGLEAGAAFLKQHHPATSHILTTPGDTPFLPADFAERLTDALDGSVRVARFCDRLQPVAACWPLACLDRLPIYLAETNDRSLIRFASSMGFRAVDFGPWEAAPRGDPFFNVNTSDDLAEARRTSRV